MNFGLLLISLQSKEELNPKPQNFSSSRHVASCRNNKEKNPHKFHESGHSKKNYKIKDSSFDDSASKATKALCGNPSLI